MSTLSLNSAVAIAISGEQGVITARIESLASEPQYRVHYKSASGEAKTEWFNPSQLQRLNTKPEQCELQLDQAQPPAKSLQVNKDFNIKSIKVNGKAVDPAPLPELRKSVRSKTAKRSSLDERLVAFLATRPNRYTTNELAKRFKVTYWVMRSAIKRTRSQALIVKEREVAA